MQTAPSKGKPDNKLPEKGHRLLIFDSLGQLFLPPATPVSGYPFLLKICVIVTDTRRYHPLIFRRNPKHHDRVAIFALFAGACLLACLLAASAACLLLAKLGRSTQDTKEGCKPRLVPPAR